MNTVLAVVVCGAFLVLGLWHFYMAFTGSSDESAAVPSHGGKPLFVPSTQATIAVGVVLMLFAVLVAATSGILALGLPPALLSWLSYALALGFFARAVGEFRYVDFFKKVRGSRFARMDALFYFPLCFLLSAGGATIAAQHAT